MTSSKSPARPERPARPDRSARTARPARSARPTRPSRPARPSPRSAPRSRPRARSRREAPPTLILLVRHGRTPTTGRHLPGRAPGLHLSEIGRGQAEESATRITALARPPVAVYASPLERTKETAAPIARALGLRVRSHSGLLECDIGNWTGARLATVAKSATWSIVQRWPSGFRFPGGESFAEMSTRANDAILELVAEHPGEAVVAVSHADPIRAVLASAVGAPLDALQRISIAPCSISAILYTPSGPMILAMGTTGSLSDLVPS